MASGNGISKTPALANGRRLHNWIVSFTRLTENMEAPELFRKWAGIGILASVLERKVWNRTRKGVLYPNLYIVLVGPPGTGKSLVVSFSEKILRRIQEIHIAPSSVTAAALVDTMQLAVRKILHPSYFQYNSLQVIVSELQNFLPKYEAPFMGMLTKLYDCELYEERRRTAKVQHIKIDNTQLSMLAGTTPSFLASLLPEGAWDQGFTSRTIFVFSPVTNSGSIFDESDDFDYNQQVMDDLTADLKNMLHLVGQIEWTKEAQESLQQWVDKGCPPVPEHGRLAHYNTRRSAHVLKLGLIASVARNNEMLVEQQDLDAAKAWLLEAEAMMPDIFRQMTTTAESRSMEDARFYIRQLSEKMKGPVPEHFLLAFLRDRVPSQNLAKVIEIMVKSHMLKATYSNGVTYYAPY